MLDSCLLMRLFRVVLLNKIMHVIAFRYIVQVARWMLIQYVHSLSNICPMLSAALYEF